MLGRSVAAKVRAGEAVVNELAAPPGWNGDEDQGVDVQSQIDQRTAHRRRTKNSGGGPPGGVRSEDEVGEVKEGRIRIRGGG